jgi:uncharacterized protein YcbX
MRLASLHLYPVKSCHRVDVDEATVLPWGLAGDRRWFPVEPDGAAITQRELPVLTQIQPTLLPGGLRLAAPGRPDLTLTETAGDYLEVRLWRSRFKVSAAGPEADAWLSEVAGRPLRLVWMDDPARRPVNPEYGRPGDVVSAADGYPLLVTNTASLAQLNDWIIEGDPDEQPVPMTRFRPNVVVDGAPAWAEDGWLGRRLRIGAVAFRVVKPCARCVMTTNNQETGERGREPLRTLGRTRNIEQNLLFGMNMIPDGTGALRVGDPVELLD